MIAIIFIVIFASLVAKSVPSTVTPNLKLVLLEDVAELVSTFNATKREFAISWNWRDSEYMYHTEGSLFKSKGKGKYISTVTRDGALARLQITNVTYDDSGMYRCSSTHLPSATTNMFFWRVIVQGRPELTNVTRGVKENGNMSATCCIRYSEPVSNITYVWSISGWDPFDVTTHKTITDGGSLSSCATTMFVVHRRYHSKMLKCLVKNELNISATSTIQVIYPARAWLKPSMAGCGHILYADLNRETNITCVSDGFPLPSVHLQRLYSSEPSQWINIPLTAKLLYQEGAQQSWTFLYRLNESNSSTLRCSAFNGLNITAENNIFVVEASYPAKVHLNSQSSLSVRPGDTVNISCTVDGNPAPDVYIQQKDTSEEWETLSLRPFEIQTYMNKTTRLAFQLHVNEKVIAHQYRCIANNTSEMFVWSDDLILAYKSFGEVLVENITYVVIAFLVLLLAALLLYRGKYFAKGFFFPNLLGREFSFSSTGSENLLISSDLSFGKHS
ncbi:synaptogenesis protein syg-2-like isoform X2 [Apostichopus japonicus]|uniref:synaptogenesis protein syg-2-like isoform X2 n=1 Tax=Stichopus japonicus TaxID=307972 RepID=UPI003AB1F6FD